MTHEDKGRQGVSFTQVKIDDLFCSPKLKLLQSVTIDACINKCWETGRISNFQKAAGTIPGEFQGTFYDDSDVYKVLEGVAYSLMTNPNPELEQRADEIIACIKAAQTPDGYIQTYFMLAKPDEKWKDMNMHEDYCIGHLLEAGIAYKQATGKTDLFEVGLRAADLMVSLFGPNKGHWVSGHQEIELALVKLYHETDNVQYLDLAEFILEERGRGFGKGYSWDREGWGAIYNQDHEPVAAMSDAKGHSVRALYMYCGMTDVAIERNKQSYLDAVNRLWDSVVNRNMYLTGGVGSSKENEGFTEDYDLPNLDAYCETCAAIAMVYWNQRMNLLYGDSKYADIIEREIYNGILSGISLSADKFFYVNPLESIGEHHRVEWFTCSCCPTQLSRFIPSIGNYIYTQDNSGITVNQFIANQADLIIKGQKTNVQIDSNYPYDGTVHITLESVGSPYILRIRKPDWCSQFSLTVDDMPISQPEIIKGYITLNLSGAAVAIHMVMDMPVVIQNPNPQVKANEGKVAFMRGPLVYAFEGIDNPDWSNLAYNPKEMAITVTDEPDLLGGIKVLHLTGSGSEFKAIPYFAWDNREVGPMKVWIDAPKI